MLLKTFDHGVIYTNNKLFLLPEKFSSKLAKTIPKWEWKLF